MANTKPIPKPIIKYSAGGTVPGAKKGSKLTVGALGAGYSTYGCFTWEQAKSYCFALTDAPVQTLPIEDYEVHTCDPFAGHPPF